MRGPLAVIETHPIQYRAPVYRAVQERFGIPVTVIYGSDFSVAGYFDEEFKSAFAWDVDLLSGYTPVFLSKVSEGGARTYENVAATGLAEMIARVNPGALLLAGYSPRFHQWAWWHAMRSGRPVLFRGETTDVSQSGGGVKRAVRNLALKALYQRCSKLLYIGAKSKGHYLSMGCEDEQLIFSPYCVDLTPFHPDEEARLHLRGEMRAELGAAEDDTVILFSGKLSERKGPDLLVEAVRALPAARRAKTLIVFLGNGELLDALRAQVAEEPAVRVHFAGFQNQSRISRYFHASDLFVLPSRRLETWGLVVNEALHHGVPCIVSEAVGCAPDLIEPGRTGETFATGSAASLGAALERLKPLAGRAATRGTCRARAAKYTVEKAAEGIAFAYESTHG